MREPLATGAPFPWQVMQWRRLSQACQGKSLPHALLLHGKQGSGVTEFAQRLAALLLCDSPLSEGVPCQHCKGCVLFFSGNHPEFLSLVPEGESRTIKIDRVREMVRFVGLTSHYGHSKVILLEPAEAMNRHAANSLLKTLEEPPPETQFILVTHIPMLLPVTIRSRCQIIRFEDPPLSVAKPWLLEHMENCPIDLELLLALADNSPLEALEMVRSKRYESRGMMIEDLEYLSQGQADPVEVAGHWEKTGHEVILKLLYSMLEDLLKLKYRSGSARILNRDLYDRLSKLAVRLRGQKLFAAYDRLINYRQLMANASNVTPLTLLEEFTICWSTAYD